MPGGRYRRREVVRVPTAVTIFPADIEQLPRRWVEERFQNLSYWNVAGRGGTSRCAMCRRPSSANSSQLSAHAAAATN
jgi:hypothetical protein